MNKYRVLKPYPKQITNSGRLVTLVKGNNVYLKHEAQVVRLVALGFLKPIVEITEKPAKTQKAQPAEENSQADEQKKISKSEYLNKKNKAE